MACAQDLITTRSGEQIRSKVLEVGPADVRYKKFDNIDGPTYMLLRSEVMSIVYENGTSDIFNDQQFEYYSKPATREPYVQDMFIRGKSDADRYYRGYKTAGTSTLLTSLLSPLVGLVPAIACASSAPKKHNLNYPDPSLMQDTFYNDGYTTQARKVKKNKVWMNWGIGFGANILLVLALSN
jgi:hypothetical protein